jgi:serine/threonine protein kinase
MKNSMQTLLGGRYSLLGTLGKGGMADVYHARDLNLQREVAIKMLRESLIEDPAFQARFLQEARAAANLTHPNIVTIFDFGCDADRYFIVMEYIKGMDLKTLIRQRGSLAVPEAVELMIQVCAGVGYAHRAGLIHCDLKPQNILVSHDGLAKITDFGIARALSTIRPDEQADIVWGSPLYSAPEQTAGAPPTPATDVYALGVTFFEMLTGALPFDAEDPASLAELHLTVPPPAPRSINSTIPDTLEQITLKVLSKEPSARYRTADQFGRVLTTFNTHYTAKDGPPAAQLTYTSISEPQTRSVSKAAPPKNAVDWLAVVLGLLAFLAVGGLIPLWLWVCLLYPFCPLGP